MHPLEEEGGGGGGVSLKRHNLESCPFDIKNTGCSRHLWKFVPLSKILS